MLAAHTRGISKVCFLASYIGMFLVKTELFPVEKSRLLIAEHFELDLELSFAVFSRRGKALYKVFNH